MSTHAPTPGPWTAKRSRHGGYAVECRGRLTNPSSTAVCSVRVHPKTLEAHAEAAATARLIAEAPTMREALRVLVGILGALDEHLDDLDRASLEDARALIAKVDGAS